MEPGRLLLRMLDDLRAKTTAPHDEYDLLRAAVLLRLLIVDGSSPVALLTRDYDLKIRYVVRHQAGITGRSGQGMTSVMSKGIAPHPKYPDAPTRTVHRSQLLKV